MISLNLYTKGKPHSLGQVYYSCRKLGDLATSLALISSLLLLYCMKTLTRRSLALVPSTDRPPFLERDFPAYFPNVVFCQSHPTLNKLLLPQNKPSPCSRQSPSSTGLTEHVSVTGFTPTEGKAVSPSDCRGC